MLVALEADPSHRSLHALIHRINHARRATALVDRLDPEIHCDIRETFALITIDNFLPRFLQIVFVHRCVELHANLLAKLLCFHAVRTIDNQFAQHLPGLHGHDHLHAVALRLCENAHVLNGPRLVKIANVVFDRRIRIRLTDRCPDLRQNRFLRHCRRAGILHFDRAYDRWSLLRVCARRREQRCAGHEKHRHRPALCRSPKFSHNQDAESRAA